jgi:subtilisin family serine protease
LRRLLFAGCAAAAALVAVPAANAARYAVGVAEGASVASVADGLESATGHTPDRHLADLRALVVEASSPDRLRALPGVAYVERIDVPRRLAFVPNDPLAARQWHLAYDHAFDFWPELPVLPGIKVAVIDSGIDGSHPELAPKIVASKSFVRTSALTDQQGHGTFVAGLIAAQTNNQLGVAGIAFPAQLLIAKVVGTNRLVSLEAEAAAIRWAVQNGARVINLSLGGVRDPRNPERDTYSALEAAAVRYAYTRGAVIVAAVGNADAAPSTPWPFASYPAALPHVIGVSALARDGSIPQFSNRDPIYNDMSAPGEDIVSTFPRQLTAARPTCDEQGYSLCGPDEYRHPEGTSFAAPQVAAAAALLFSVRPALQPDQVMYLLERAAEDVNEQTGCKRCPSARDAFSGWGTANVARALAALEGTLPARDRFESNDDAGGQATPLKRARGEFVSTLDYWDDPLDVYKTYVRRRQRITVALDGPKGSDTNLVLWKPGTRRVEGLSLALLRQRAAQSVRPGARERLTYRAKTGGWYYIQVKLGTKDSGAYRLRFTKR